METIFREQDDREDAVRRQAAGLPSVRYSTAHARAEMAQGGPVTPSNAAPAAPERPPRLTITPSNTHVYVLYLSC